MSDSQLLRASSVMAAGTIVSTIETRATLINYLVSSQPSFEKL